MVRFTIQDVDGISVATAEPDIFIPGHFKGSIEEARQIFSAVLAFFKVANASSD